MLRGIGKWCLDNLALSIGLTIYFIVQILTATGRLPAEDIQKYVPSFFATIIIIISVNALKYNRQIDELKNYLKLDKVEFTDRTSTFFEKLINLVDEKSTMDVFYVSRNPLTSFKHPSVERYRDKIQKLIEGNSEKFIMRRLFLVNSKSIAESICSLHEKHKDSSSYYMRAMETDLDFAFTGYLIINKRYCFIILPRFPDSDLKSIFIDSETIGAAFLERYNELWKTSNPVNDEYCTRLKSLYSS